MYGPHVPPLASAIEAAGGNGASLLHVPDKASAAAEASSALSLGLGNDAAAEAEKVAALSGEEGLPTPPRSLMAFPPVARLLNVVLTSFNQLREVRKGEEEPRNQEDLTRDNKSADKLSQMTPAEPLS